ncbi:tyrosine-protein phosphatase [Parapedobacter tibetensis]|uniref:tyrosine-protein phosphatase n=1 Tax=Parapedobacter tibetensis TaxID=2972951 RepID=UPI00214DB4B7|nr:tyrosine-protein phosphatase [Parapedobacter tibetensis]
MKSNKIWLATGMVLVVIGCGRRGELPPKEITLQEAYRAERTGNSYRLQLPANGFHKIFQSDSTLVFDWGHPRIETADTLVELPVQGERTFFAIVSIAGDTTIVSERKIAVAGPANLRDIGGLKTDDGRTVRWGRFYRSDKLSELTDAQFGYFNALGIRKVIDLRMVDEIEAEPDHLPAGLEPLHLSIFDDQHAAAFAGVQEKITNGQLTVADAKRLLVEANAAFATIYAPKFKQVVRETMDADGPVLYHCTAGKDRTGFTTALILSILGVDRQTIMDEYLMTNYYTHESMTGSLDKANWGSMLKADLDPEVVIPLLIVDETYLQAAFDAIDREYGGMDEYLRNQIGITDSLKQVYRQRFTYGPNPQLSPVF